MFAILLPFGKLIAFFCICSDRDQVFRFLSFHIERSSCFGTFCLRNDRSVFCSFKIDLKDLSFFFFFGFLDLFAFRDLFLFSFFNDFFEQRGISVLVLEFDLSGT